ncbi:hypothetical protein N9A86_04465 [Akkermansiaceae bacterium]|nr:hypothetical protein [Akkermansiaceae bacterium]MDB4537898.1 hypothetical protein [Akkermansiaceae bacterium]
MGLFDFFKKEKKSASNNSKGEAYTHPVFGKMEDNDGDWFVDDFKTPIFERPFTVSLVGGDEGPGEEALEGYEFITKNWKEIIHSYGIFDAFYEMHEAYVDGMKTDLVDRSKFWKTVIPQYLSVSSKDTLSFSVCFTWQDPRDGHTITAEIEDGECVGCPVDG